MMQLNWVAEAFYMEENGNVVCDGGGGQGGGRGYMGGGRGYVHGRHVWCMVYRARRMVRGGHACGMCT